MQLLHIYITFCFVLNCPGATAGKPGKYVIQGKTITIQKRVNLEIVSGDLTNRQVPSLLLTYVLLE